MTQLRLLSGVLLTLSLGFLSREAFAQKQQKSQSQNQSQSQSKSQKRPLVITGIVVTDGAIVYMKPDFDATILGEMKQGQRVQVSNGTVATDPRYKDSPRFYKVKVGGKIGYVADIDVRTAKKPAANSSKQAAKKKKSPNQSEDKKPRLVSERQPMAFTRYIGALIGANIYKEKISGVKAEETIIVYGLKITGPDVIFSGPLIDLNLALHYGAPSYYNDLSKVKPRGFMLFTDLLLIAPLRMRDTYMLYGEVGPSLAYSSFSVINDEKALSLTQLNLGATLGFGAAVRIDKVAVRLEARYTAEKTSYPSALFSVQGQF